jgi:molybdate transport system regulatory protein
VSVQPRVKVWIVFGSRTKLGEGRARLFELIDELGSLQQAVTRMGMSYRAAWGYIRELEAAAGFAFLERKRGGGAAGGVRLTSEGRAFVARYRRFRRSLEELAAQRFGRAFE